MATLVGTGRSTNRQSTEAGRAAASEAMGALRGRRAGLVLVFATVGYDQPALLRAVTSATDGAPLSGCSGEGVITAVGSDEGSHSVSVTAIASDEITFQTLRIREVSRDPRDAAARFCEEWSRRSEERARVALLLPDGLTINCTELLEAIQQRIPRAVTLVGGAAGDALQFQRSYQYHDGEVDSDSLSAVLIGGDVSAETIVSHGSDPFGVEHTVTRAERGRVQEIDGRPAWRALVEYLGDHTGGLNPLDVAYLCVAERLPGECDPEYGQYVVRVPLGLDRESGTVFFPGGLTSGARFRIAQRNQARVQQHALASVRRLLERRPGERPLLVLQFDCAGRGRLLFGERASEAMVEPLQRAVGADVPWAGFHSYGEIGPLLGRACYHNYTVVLCALYRGAARRAAPPRPPAARGDSLPRVSNRAADQREEDRVFEEQLRVRTERQLYESQRQVERQLGRIHALNRFALAASAHDALATPGKTLSLAAEMLFGVTPFEQAVGLLPGAAGELRPAVVAARCGREADSARALAGSVFTASAEALASLRTPRLVGPSCDEPGIAALCRCLEELFARERPSEPRGAPAQLLLPLRRRDGVLLGALALRCISTCVTFHDPLPGPADIPFLELVRAHVEAALEGAVLRKELADLAAELERRVERRTAELVRKDSFLAMLSHELRNPLAPIRNCLYILDHAEPGGEQAATAKEILRRQSDHLSHLVDDLLDLTRISRGKIQLARHRVELGSLVRRAIEDHGSEFAQRDVAVELRVDSAPLWSDADATRISQVISNLLQNACKFTDSGGHVTVSATREDGLAVIRVADDGMGIAPELLPRLFHPFTQADQSLDRGRGGLGLGLALVKGLVEQHGGTVEARSGGPGRGAEFTVRLALVA